MLSSYQRTLFHGRGYLILKKFFPADECDRLTRRMQMITDSFAERPVHNTIFSTTTHRHQKDKYFLESANTIHYFLEEGAVDSCGSLNRPFSGAINKVGHTLHRDDPVFRKFCLQPDIVNLIKDLNYLREPHPVQSMYIFKQPEIGGEVTPHQDSTFIHTTPDRILGLWVALEDASRENGCLYGFPGPDWTGSGQPLCRFKRHGGSCSFEGSSEGAWPESGFIPLEVNKGSLILFSGLFPHTSGTNRSRKSRHAFTLHFVDKNCHYGGSNWIPAEVAGLPRQQPSALSGLL